MNRNTLSLLLALIVVALVIYFFRTPLLTLLRLPENRISFVAPTATPTPRTTNDSLTPPPSNQELKIESNFTKIGHLTRNNSGQESGLWYLTYDENGSPALNIKINFDKTTFCSDCNTENLKSGDRVEIKGVQADSRSEVKVSQIKLISAVK